MWVFFVLVSVLLLVGFYLVFPYSGLLDDVFLAPLLVCMGASFYGCFVFSVGGSSCLWCFLAALLFCTLIGVIFSVGSIV